MDYHLEQKQKRAESSAIGSTVFTLCVFAATLLTTSAPASAEGPKASIFDRVRCSTLFNYLFPKSTPRPRVFHINQTATSEALGIPVEKLFPNPRKHTFHFWKTYDNEAKVFGLQQDTFYEALGQVMLGMDKRQAAHMSSPTGIAEWKRVLAAIKDRRDLNETLSIDGRVHAIVRCEYGSCTLSIRDTSKKHINADSFAKFGDGIAYSPRLEPDSFTAVYMHDLPPDLPPPSAEAAKFGVGPDGYLSSSLTEAKKFFRTERQYHQFTDLAQKIGFTAKDLWTFLGANGHHRGIEMILSEVKANALDPDIGKRLREKSEFITVGSAGGGWMPKLLFKGNPHVAIYRGAPLPESELQRLFKMDWETYSESYNSARGGQGFSPFGSGRYFSIDPTVGQHFALTTHPPNARTEPWYQVMVEAKVPADRLKKDSEMSRWSVGEYQYDPTSIAPNEIVNFIFYVSDGVRAVIPAELLRNKDYAKVVELLSEAGVPPDRIARILGIP